MDGHEKCRKQKLVPSSLLEMLLAGLEESGVQRRCQAFQNWTQRGSLGRWVNLNWSENAFNKVMFYFTFPDNLLYGSPGL